MRLWCEITEVGEDGVVSRFVPVEELFAGRHFDAEIVVLCVRWYLSFKLSYRDLVGMMSERGIRLVHTTILNIARSKDRCQVAERCWLTSLN